MILTTETFNPNPMLKTIACFAFSFCSLFAQESSPQPFQNPLPEGASPLLEEKKPPACIEKPTWNIEAVPDKDELYGKLARQFDIPWPTCNPTIVLPGCWVWINGCCGWNYTPTCLICWLGTCKDSHCPTGSYPGGAKVHPSQQPQH